MPRLLLSLGLIAVFPTSCSSAATPIPGTEGVPSPEPTVMPSPAPSPFIVLAYATNGIFADIIPY